MTLYHKVIKYCAMAFALFLAASIIGGILAGLGGLTWFFSRDGDDIVGEMKGYTVNQDIREIEIEISAADCRIVKGDVLSVESNSGKLTVRDGGGKLYIHDGTRSLKKGNVIVTVTVPENAHYEKIDITADAGDIEAEKLTSSSLSLECGAGDVKIIEATATFRAEIEGGVGEITVDGGALNNLDLDMGVGNLMLTSELTGNSELDLGVGETRLTLLGGEERYAVNLDKGIGMARINGNSLSDGSVYGNGENRVDIDSGVGDVEVSFATAG